jgi:hypothetical protein
MMSFEAAFQLRDLYTIAHGVIPLFGTMHMSELPTGVY